MKNDSRWLFSSILAGLLAGIVLSLPFFVRLVSAHNARVDSTSLIGEIRQTMLNSHQLWQTLSGKAIVTLYDGKHNKRKRSLLQLLNLNTHGSK